MPKFKMKGNSDPYLNYLQLRQYGVRKYGMADEIHKKLGEDLLNTKTW